MDPDRKYVLFVATGVGLGHLLGAVLNSAYYAWRTDRGLALDMREFQYVGGDKHAGFFEHFSLELPHDLEVITDLDVIDRLRQDDDLHFLQLYTEVLDVAQPFPERVLVIPCLVPGDPYPISAKRKDIPFHVNLRGRLLEAWREVMRRPEWSGPVIGLHYRSTVGEVTERMTKAITPDYEERYRAVKDDYIATALAVAQQTGFANPAFLVTSDDMDFVTYVRERLPNSFSLATRLPDQEWAAWVRAHGHDFRILSEAVNDLWCLSACDHLLHYRSGFSHFAILNSTKLDAATTHYVHVPALKEILDSLGPQEAVAWARGAVRKNSIRRLQQRYLHDWLADALERVGQTEAAAAERQRAQWHWECHFHPVVDNPDKPHIEARTRRGDFTGVLERAQRAVQELPGNPFWLSGYGGSLSDVLAQARRFHEAIEPARRAIEIEPEDPFLHERLGFVLTHAGNLEEGEQEIRRAIAIDPEIARFHSALAENLQRQHRGAEALGAQREAARVEPDDPHVIRRLGGALLQSGDYAGAEAAFRKALTVREEAGAHIELSDALARQRRLAEALSQVQAAIALEPNNPHWHNRMAHVLLLADLPAAAEAEARAAVQLEPDHSGFQDTLVATLQRQGRADEALAESQRAADLAPQDVPRMVRLARALAGSGRPAEAEPVLLRAVALRPDMVDVHDLLSIVLERQDRRTEAAAAAQRAAELLPDDLGRRHRIAQVRMQMRDLAGAERVLREADLLASRSTTFQHHHLLGIVFEWQGRREEAIAEARKASAAEPGNWDLLGRVGTLSLAAKKFDEADAVARRALALRPDNESNQRLLASIQQQRPEPAAPSQEPAATEVISMALPTQHFGSVGAGEPLQEPATTEVVPATLSVEHSDVAEPVHRKIPATPRRLARQWRAVLPSSLRQLLSGSLKSD